MSTRGRAAWREVDFERWFKQKPVLPSGERLLIVKGHDPVSRMVDLAAIDAEGSLVVLEVKNESAHRPSIGQALEYLAHLEEVSLEDLEDDFAADGGGSLQEEFTRVFRTPLIALSPRRRVFLVAPTHDSYAAVCASYLSRRFERHDVHFSLLTATQSDDGFALSEPDYPQFKRPTSMPEAFGVSPSGRLFFVLDSTTPAIVWSIGHWRAEAQSVTVSEGPSLTALRYHRRHLLPLAPPPHVDRTMAGSCWRHGTKQYRSAVVIGSVRAGSGDNLGEPMVVFAQFKESRFQTFRRRPALELKTDWVRIAGTPAPWRDITAAATAERLRRRTVHV